MPNTRPTVADTINLSRVRGKRIVLPETSDPRILEAAAILASTYGIEPCLANPQGAAPDLLEELAAAYLAGPRKTKPAIASRLMQKPLFFGAMLVKTGHGDALVAGAANPTKKVIEAGRMAIGLAPGIDTPSSFFLMQHSTQTFIFADCAVNVEPTPGELCDIALSSAASAKRLLGDTPRIAFLSFSTHASASHPGVTRVREAVALTKKAAPDLAIDGELQVDAALSPEVAAKKIKTASKVAGRANVLIFPDLASANIGYKLVQYLGGAQAIGPVLQGFARPVTDLSRGATVSDIVDAALLSAALADQDE